ncbi:MAG: EAL domain-containing protein, partial [Clostridia bacterium]|nr:EAL domain-containing protein [Clostridia bacterium]
LFESPYFIIIILILCFVLLVSVGIVLAVKGINTAISEDKNKLANIGSLEKIFKKTAKQRKSRCIMYVGVAMDNFRSLHSEEEIHKVYNDIKAVFENAFSDADMSVYEKKNFVVLSGWTNEEARKIVSGCRGKINRCLLKHNALNAVDIRIGSFFAYGTEVDFDEAVFRAKKACVLAKNENAFYIEWNASSGKALEKKLKIENEIEKEIDNNRFFLEYQPVLDAKTKKIIGAEVLSRLNSESDGVLTPRSFLSAVDSAGVTEKFDYYIFEKNCKWISNDKKQREGYKYTINFSRATLSEPAFADNIIEIAEKYNLEFSCLAVEILEDKNISGEAKKQMIENLSTLKEKGVSVLLDDFGSGYTTFGDLQNLDISVVKIDKSITHNAVTDTGFIILKNIIKTSSDIGFKTLCEGIETKEHEEVVIRAGCDMLQGYYYYKPMPVAQLEKLLDGETGGV